MNDVQYMMAFIDWQKYGGCFRKLQEYPQNVSVCAYTMLGEFSQKDLLRGLPADAPWQLINEIKSLGQQFITVKNSGRTVDANLEARLKGLCLQFNSWASSYFASETPPWKRVRTTTSSSGGSHKAKKSNSGCGCLIFLIVGLIVLLMLLAHR